MKQLAKTWFTPKHQRDGKPEVKFELKPLDQRTYMIMDNDLTFRRKSVFVGPDGVLAAFEHSVTGWQGLEAEYSELEKKKAASTPSRDFMHWQNEIASKLFRDAELGETEAKNS